MKRTVLQSTQSFEIVSIEWTSQSVSQLHNHGWSQCMVQIESGTFENHLDLGLKTELQVLEAGQTLNTPVGAQHKMRCLSPTGKTFHVYTPRIKEHGDALRFCVPSVTDLQGDLRLSEATKIEALRKVMAQVREHSVATHSPYFMNQLFTGISPITRMSDDLISETKSTMATYEASPAFTAIEAEVVESLGAIIGWPKNQREGVGVPGGSSANFMAVHCARQKLSPDSKRLGNAGHSFKIFVSTEAHYSFKKACTVLGLGTDALVLVPADKAGRMIASELDKKIQLEAKSGTPLLVCATAGTTVTGAFDPIEELADVCQRHGLWLHVDGAWGGPALFSFKIKNLMKGVERADSVTFDAHKLFGAALTCSFFLTRHSGLLLEANDVSGGEYLFHADDVMLDRGKLSWQCGRGAEALSFWSVWKSLGTDGLGQFVDRLLEVRNQTLEWIKTQARLELVAAPEYLNVCVRIRPPHGEDSRDWSRQVRESLRQRNLAMVNYSKDAEGSFLRLIYAHPNLQLEHVQAILNWALEVGV